MFVLEQGKVVPGKQEYAQVLFGLPKEEAEVLWKAGIAPVDIEATVLLPDVSLPYREDKVTTLEHVGDNEKVVVGKCSAGYWVWFSGNEDDHTQLLSVIVVKG